MPEIKGLSSSVSKRPERKSAMSEPKSAPTPGNSGSRIRQIHAIPASWNGISVMGTSFMGRSSPLLPEMLEKGRKLPTVSLDRGKFIPTGNILPKHGKILHTRV
jgi:hypothetical protein